MPAPASTHTPLPGLTAGAPSEASLRADPLSDVLQSVRLSGAVFFHIEGSSPWVAEAPPSRAVAGIFMPRAQHVIEYHAVTRGGCWGGIVGERPARLDAGDVIVFPQGDAHVLSSEPGLRAPPDLATYASLLDGPPPVHIPLGGGGADRAEILCGFLGCDARPFNPLLATLPRVLHARLADARGSALETFMEAALRETRERRPGGESVLARLSELMFVEVVRSYLAALPAGNTGWLAGLRDEFVGRALALLHGRPAHPWTLDELARKVALSRSALAERFTQLVGRPPMQYLAGWRMQLAAGLLLGDSAGVSQVAAEVGYASDAAFSRAFKKAVGVPPAAWRRSRSAKPVPGAAATTG
ncbi:AraC family transcriptional regulator [Anaeromyxobacter sp. Fw109-5]|uniref:AraC family transcriptional regulator n=1 Tax=Anaeromyxobacter sp. (strain Fw109-5) TaxID=404589 RepID=UPI000158A797|nr:AraC family transcriptional regulator [Anaeromyxobacter sp. Fw109-5]ABS25804.1 helix-turn-helix- domain containing protein AraC type [Anaeromyxobacter sp. Fw109-5]